MSMIRISMAVPESVFTALAQAADVDRMDLREAAAALLEEGLQRRGLLEKASNITGRGDVAVPSRACDGVASMICAVAGPSTDEVRHARK
jgi:hypothetical protein